MLIAMSMLFAGCREGDAEATESTAVTEPSETSEQTTEPEFELESLTVDGVDISEYKIIYAQTEYSSDVYGKFENEYDFDRLSAKRLAELIKENFGVSLKVSVDTSTAATEREILIGKTNRTETETAGLASLKTDKYKLAMYGKKLVICGGVWGSTWHALDALEAEFEAHKQSKTANVALASDYKNNGEYHIKTVACLGDSITYGAVNGDVENFSYPANMQRILWRDYVVEGFGQSGSTMIDDLSDAYRSKYPYRKFMEKAVKYDLVLIMLGTNDGNRVLRQGEWTDSWSEKFLSSCKGLVGDVLSRSPNAKLVLMNCPVYYGSANYGTQTVRNLQKEAVRALRADGVDIQLYDMYKYTAKEMGTSMFPDSLHPSAAGYAKMAEGVAELAEAVLNGGENKYLIDVQ